MDKDKALKLALEALEEPREHIAKHRRLEAINAIKEALAQPEQDDGMCQACEENQCTAKQGCVALDNPSQPEQEKNGC